MTSENKKYTALMVFMFIAISTLADFFLSIILGEDAIQSAINKIAFYSIAAISCLGLWFVGIKVMRLDEKGPVPWYASPVLWLSPVFVGVLILMFWGGI
jgi:hypothetical protein